MKPPVQHLIVQVKGEVMKKIIYLITVLLLLIGGCIKEERDDIRNVYKNHEQPILEDEETYSYGLYNGNAF